MKPIFSPPLTGGHVLAMLIAFFGVVFTVNGVFVYVAEKSWSGLETTNPFVKGLDYNQEIAEARVQQARGWSVSLEQAGNNLTAAYRDRAGTALDDLSVTAYFSRAATNRYDSRRDMKALGGGRYGLVLALPLKGEWRVRVEARRGQEKNYITEQTIFVK